MLSYEQFASKLEELRTRIKNACDSSGRSFSEVRILPVTKNHPVDAALYALKAGLGAVGENRVQEAESKIPLVDSNLQWELIGHLQSNKAKRAVELFSRIESVDSVHLAKKIDSHAAAIGKKQRILLQINAGADPAKFGASLDDARALFDEVLKFANLKVEGLMTIAPLDDDLLVARKTFANLRTLRDSLQDEFKISLSELSMGMSHDLECAVEEGATLVRVGTFLYGQRDYGAKY